MWYILLMAVTAKDSGNEEKERRKRTKMKRKHFKFYRNKQIVFVTAIAATILLFAMDAGAITIFGRF